ncbi:porin [Marinomonas ushuaiensis DSM 15871]|uniref:Porin n=1 Tax=Marinomonas ushuaiensis DSM 15871 TaxID=1122207 RepID=X7E2U8_9GAMM|nr:porin [Marinomonas ushuaiensis]ETX09498.1 porin [Marinomonas ushuaiensis DSM 15871]
MKKSIIAIAVSSVALTSVSAYAAEGSTVDIYGNIQYVISDTEGAGDFADNGSTLGVQGETKVNDDLTGFFKYELEFDADEDGDGANEAQLDQAFVGLQGNFGKVKVGSFDSIYNDAIQDGIDQFEYLGLGVADTAEEGDTIAYFSPSFGGFEFQVSSQVNTAEGAGNATTAVAKYSVDALTISAGYDSLDDGDDETIGFAASYQVSPALSVTAKTESTTDVQDIVGLATRYGYGAGDLYASAQVVSPDSADDYNEYAAGVTYSLASNMYVYGEVGQLDATEDTTTAVGVYYGF